MGSVWNKLVKHELYRKFDIHYPTGINFCEDIHVMARLLLHISIIEYTPAPYYHYVMNPKSLSHDATRETFAQRKNFIESLQQFLGPSFESEIAQNLVYIREDAYYSRLYKANELRNFLPHHRLAVFKSSRHLRKKLLLFFASIGITTLSRLLERKKDGRC